MLFPLVLVGTALAGDVPTTCIGFRCAAGCNGTKCAVGCVGEECAMGCTGEKCGEQCIGPRCAHRCTGDDCGMECTGPMCAANCKGVMCANDCQGVGCAFMCVGTDCSDKCEQTRKGQEISCNVCAVEDLTDGLDPTPEQYVDLIHKLIAGTGIKTSSHVVKFNLPIGALQRDDAQKLQDTVEESFLAATSADASALQQVELALISGGGRRRSAGETEVSVVIKTAVGAALAQTYTEELAAAFVDGTFAVNYTDGNLTQVVTGIDAAFQAARNETGNCDSKTTYEKAAIFLGVVCACLLIALCATCAKFFKPAGSMVDAPLM